MVKRYGKKVKRMGWKQVREAAPLPCRQQIEADHPEAILPAAELERIYGQLKRRETDGHKIPYDALPVVSVSQCAQSARANARGRGALVPPRPLRADGVRTPSVPAAGRLPTIPTLLPARCARSPPRWRASGARVGISERSPRAACPSTPRGASRTLASSSVRPRRRATAAPRRADRRPPAARRARSCVACARACRQIMRACIRTSPCRAHPFRTSASRARCATVRARQSRGGVGSG